MSEATEREKFEATHLGGMSKFTARNSTTGEYVNPCLENAWQGWQARAALSGAEQVVAPPPYALMEAHRVNDSNEWFLPRKDYDTHQADHAYNAGYAKGWDRRGEYLASQPVAAAPVGVRGSGVGHSTTTASETVPGDPDRAAGLAVTLWRNVHSGWWVVSGTDGTGIYCAHPTDPALCMRDVVDAWKYLADRSPSQVPPFPHEPPVSPGADTAGHGGMSSQ